MALQPAKGWAATYIRSDPICKFFFIIPLCYCNNIVTTLQVISIVILTMLTGLRRIIKIKHFNQCDGHCSCNGSCSYNKRPPYMQLLLQLILAFFAFIAFSLVAVCCFLQLIIAQLLLRDFCSLCNWLLLI